MNTDKDKYPLVSIIIPVYQAEKYLVSCIKSILVQKYKNIKVYLINDGSTDKSANICEEFASSDKRITVRHKENEGAAAARNLGLEIVDENSQYVLFLDSDDTLINGAILELVEIAVRTESDIVMPDRYVKKSESSGKEEISWLFPSKNMISNPKEFAKNVMIREGRAWRASALLYSYNVILKSNAKFPVGHTAEDLIFNLQVMRIANDIAFYQKPTLVNLKHQGSVTATFQPTFNHTIKFIDQRVREFLVSIGTHIDEANDYADALLFRNIVVYLISIMSSTEMSLTERKILAKELLNNEFSQDVLNRKIPTPYFNRKSVRIIMPFIYFLIRNGKRELTINILAMVFR